MKDVYWELFPEDYFELTYCAALARMILYIVKPDAGARSRFYLTGEYFGIFI